MCEKYFKPVLCLLLTIWICLSVSFPARADSSSQSQTSQSDSSSQSETAEENPALSGILSDAYVVMDGDSGQVLVEKNLDKREFPASITKILTVALALEHKKLTDTHVMSEEAVFSIPRDTSHIALTNGEEVTIEQLLYATMLMSANDAANGLAEATAGSLEKFVEMMNDKLQEIGAVNTHFTNAHGLPDDNHYTTARDMALITRYAMSVPGFNEIFGADSYTMAPTNKQPEERPFGTAHSMIVTSSFTYEGAFGGKLGWTEEANHTSVTVARRGDMTLICVALKTYSKYDKYKDTAALFDYCFDNFQTLTLTGADLESFDKPLVDGEGNPVGKVHIEADAAAQFPLRLYKDYLLSDVTISYQVQEQYTQGKDISPTMTLSIEGGNTMYGQLGSYPLTYTAAVDADASPSVNPPQEDRSIGARTAWIVFKTVMILLAAGIVACLVIRQINLNRQRKRLAARRRARRNYSGNRYR